MSRTSSRDDRISCEASFVSVRELVSCVVSGKFIFSLSRITRLISVPRLNARESLRERAGIHMATSEFSDPRLPASGNMTLEDETTFEVTPSLTSVR